VKTGREHSARARRERLVELGDEPALSLDQRSKAPPHGAVSSRWLAGTVLTGFASTALMGGALYASLDWEMRFARSAEVIASSVVEIGQSRAPGSSARKGDRVAAAPALVASKQTLQLDTVTRVGERQYLKARPFVRLSASLVLHRTEITQNLQPFNPLRVFGSGEDEAFTRPVERAVEADISLVMKDLDDAASEFESVADLGPDEVASMVRETAEIGVRMRAETALAPIAHRGLDPGAASPVFGSRDLEAYVDLAARGYAENVSLIARSARQVAPEKAGSVLGPDDRVVDVRPGDTLELILTANGASREEALAMIGVMEERFPASRLKPGFKIRMGVSPGEDDRTRLRPVRVSIYEGEEHRATVALSDNGVGYVAVEDPADLVADAPEPEEEEVAAGVRPTLHASLYETAHKNGLPRSIVDTLVRLYSYDVDLQRSVKPGDMLEVFYAPEEAGGAAEIFYAALTLEGEARRLYRHQMTEDGSIGFFDEYGKSARKFLMNKPLQGGVFRSGFAMRRHPILGYAKFHTGVDYSAPRGTPIMAAGDGVVEKAGWESGYGKYVRLQHSNGYQTAYGHMSDYAKGIAVGTRVRQGQILGYVGSTGLSTGNHLHYEVMYKGAFQNPMRLKIPRGRELGGAELSAFERERDRINWVMMQPSNTTRLAGSSHVAAER